ncbi:MAG: GTP 3',8-cyclase MoaA [Candidatus Bathyarchaeota archaeon]|nr:GTP 3',8-cyclase MoaA [Candidatus Termiticorpusculum sp.]MCL1970939.1 GTP 3',8-cyclase MoaA [Candidatus Termiticorpusculum sp.]
MGLSDNFGRPLFNLRISVTQQCNYNCTYCHREGEVKPANSGNTCVEMTSDEIIYLAKLAIDLGVTRIKLTGGEPLMRPDICQIVEGIAGLSGLKDLSLTTNGYLLYNTAQALHDAGLSRVNISLASLNPENYQTITGGGVIDKALAGVKAAVNAGFNPVKLNMVLLKNINVSDVPDMILYAEKMGIVLQLIELDPVNVSRDYYLQHHCNLKEQEEMLQKRAIYTKQRQFMHNRIIYHLSNVNVEVVHPVENTDFCMHCTRLRITSDGKLKPCLMQNNKLTDILTPMRQGAGDEELLQLFKQANQLREPYNKNHNQHKLLL